MVVWANGSAVRVNVVRRHSTLFAFVVCALAACGALAWVTAHALRLEGEQRAARGQAVVQERIRLALWRMDSTVGAVLSREAARPYFVYQSFYPAERAYTKMLEPVHGGEVLVPSPLLAAEDKFVRLHFQITEDGSFTSPQAPLGTLRDLAQGSYVSPGVVEAAQQRLLQVEHILGDSRRLVRRELSISPQRVELSDAVVNYIENALNGGRLDQAGGEGTAQSLQLQSQIVMQQSADEYRARQALSTQNRASPSEWAQAGRGYKTDAPARGNAGSGAPEQPSAGSETASVRAPAAATAGSDPSASGRVDGAFDRRAGGSPPAPGEFRRGAASSLAEAEQKEAPGALKKLEADKAPAPTHASRESALPGDAKRTEGEALAEKQAWASKDRADRDAEKAQLGFAEAASHEAQVQIGAFEASWVGGAAHADAAPAETIRPTGTPGIAPSELVFMRDVAAGDTIIRQGFWVDWPALRGELLRGVHDLLPRAQLHPLAVADDRASPAELGRRLASFPAEIDPGDVTQPLLVGWSPLRVALGVSWGGMLLALAAIATVLHAATDLAERRGRFVSAVTHELRTPLTTFCLYSQMLADGMVPEGEARQEYLHTLRRESSRLAGIVETVLDYARLGRRHHEAKGRADPRTLPAGELVERVLPALAQRAAQGGMSLIATSTIPEGWTIRGDVSAVERILYNLVDNSCKYAGAAEDKRIEVSARLEGSRAVFRVGDHGPGIAPDDRQRVFKAFERGNAQGDGSIPGLGLGLALAQGLARDLGGRLRLVETQPAVFELELPGARG